ncbi:MULTISPECIES: cysteine desulfurase family protein [Mesorhizobium]|uniref:cysteine desulfurase family protein n=1 Tax=Mesorhizobium TaxID=68287 RepID=UPI0012E2FF64|nr:MULTISPECIES: cysteine desulfurase family protein [Mesorhizobium]
MFQDVTPDRKIVRGGILSRSESSVGQLASKKSIVTSAELAAAVADNRGNVRSQELRERRDANGFLSAPPPRINLDANANAAPTPKVVAAVVRALHNSANPSSAHAAGDEARVQLEQARDAVSALCRGVYPENVIFTSGCTEANNLVVATAKALGATLITTTVEHPSVLRPAYELRAAGHDVRFVPVDAEGCIELPRLQEELQIALGPIVLSVQTANSETGVLQPIGEIAAVVADRKDVLFHSDAAQGLGKFELALGGRHGPHVVTVSAHKLHGPMGVGAILMSEGEDRLRPLLVGGDQERGLRAGTQSLPLITGFGAACEERRAHLSSHVAYMALLRDRLEAGVVAALPGVTVGGAGGPRLPNTSNLRFPGMEAMALVALLDAEGVLASQGSACHSHRPEPSPVLMAMGVSEADAFSAVRFSVSPLNTTAEIDAAISIIVQACQSSGFCK